MMEVESELYKLRRAGEDAAQRGRARASTKSRPIFENANLATDHQMMAMETLQARRAEVRPGLPAAREAVRRRQRLGQAQQLVACATTSGNNLLNPGDTPHDNAQFLVFCAAVHPRRRQVSRACCASSVASAGNDHRLGANEAPPAIISVFLGDMLTDIFEQIEKGGAKSTKQRRHARDRRRRAAEAAARRRRPQPHQPVRLHRQQVRVPRGRRRARASRCPNICAELVVAESLDYIATELEKAVASAARRSRTPSRSCCRRSIKEHKRIIFNGDGYSEEWHEGGRQARPAQPQEHRRRAAASCVTPEVVALFEQVQGAQRARAARALRDHASRPTTRRSTSRRS